MDTSKNSIPYAIALKQCLVYIIRCLVAWCHETHMWHRIEFFKTISRHVPFFRLLFTFGLLAARRQNASHGSILHP
jgi:hypothetical protein